MDPGQAVEVKVGDQALNVAGEVHELGATFTAPYAALADVLARGLVEREE